MHPKLVNYVTFPMAQLYLKRTHWRQELRNLCKMQWLDQEELQNLQVTRLRDLVQYSIDYIPYYRDLMTRKGIRADDVQDFHILRELPPLNREILNEEIDRLHNKAFPLHYYVNTSSGSTGHPVAFYDDGLKAGVGVAEEARLKHNFGVPIGVPEARFARLTEDTISQDGIFRWRRRLINQLMLPGMNLSDEIFARTKEQLFRLKPQVLFGISSAVFDFTRFLMSEGLREIPWKVDLVICWAAPVFDYYVELLSTFYQCPVVNLYSSREVGHLASSCPMGNMHLHEENRIFEILKEGKPVGPGERGQIVVTTLPLFAMPMIRYETGDIGAIGTEKCECGRGLTVLKDLEGRSGDILYLSNGKIISPNYCCRLLMSPEFVGVIKQFQVIQKDGLSLEIRLVRNEGFKNTDADGIAKLLKESIGGDVAIQLSYVDQIDPLPSGKFQICRRSSWQSVVEAARDRTPGSWSQGARNVTRGNSTTGR